MHIVILKKPQLCLIHLAISRNREYLADASAAEITRNPGAMINALKNLTADKEALEAIKQGYQLIYPEPRIISGWKGDEIEVDWKYVFNENFDLARMLRKPEGDYIVGTDVLERLGVV